MLSRKLLSRFGIDPYLFALIGTVALALTLPARGAMAVVMDHASFLAVSLLFFLYGARLAPKAVVEGLTHWRLQSVVFGLTFVLFPILGVAASAGFASVLPRDLSQGLLYLTLMPSTIQSSIAFTSIARGNVPAALCSASASNLIGVALSPALVALLMATDGSGISLKAVEDVSLQLLLPFALGQAVRPFIAGFLHRHKAITSIVDRGSILLIVYVAFAEGTAAGVWSLLSWKALGVVMALDFAILLIALVFSTWLARRLGFSKEDEIAIVFCGSKKSMASGLPMASILFPNAALGLFLLPLMLFHQIQLFACAVLAQRYARRPVAEPAPHRKDAIGLAKG
ncbi:bile acid:sodium symporter family protein [Methylocella sp.]|uniref:bile acid:sodium symporter family protein n=1 Tax=Methylocella sp. TaxID=1978226 RepID=UPI00378398BB